MENKGRHMKQLIVPFCLIALALPIYVCAAPTPVWINGISPQHTAREYLVGVGVGDTLEGARSSARAEIAKVFTAKVVQSSQDTKKERTSQEGAISQFSSRQDTALTTSVSTDEVLQGVEIVETWQDPKKKTYYALAVLNKLKTRQALTQQIADQEELCSSSMARAAGAASVIEKLRALNGALDALRTKDELIVRKQVVDPVVVSEPGGGKLRADIETQKAGLVKKIQFIIQTDDTPNLAARITEKLNGLGFITYPAPPERQAADIMLLLVSAKTTITPVERKNPQWVFYGWHGTVSITEAGAGGQGIATIVKDGQSSQLTQEAAKTKAVADAVREIANATEQEINRYIFGK